MTHTLTAPCSYQEDIKKSRFVAYAAPVATVEEAMRFFAERGDPEATHNCWAYRIGQEYRFNDDGEPGGTAGRPILQAIEGQDMDRVAVLVVRWYGGIKLGAGGLVRAYGGCAANCLRLGQRSEIVDLATVRCACGFADLALLKSRLAQAGAVVQQEDFNEDGVALCFVAPRTVISDLEVTVANITRGRSAWEVLS
ncbi:IMPACT family protein [Achromobacter sp. MY14]|uniref:IMPACT family protein n=1 Tax=unclassified Achromobacter TaxID=2626865 RepID=UPI001E46D165|nr:YigZ family protein [Achromobacter sp. MY14]MCD0499086.1 IMPACT family protein [Achromobacter sp. MY14]